MIVYIKELENITLKNRLFNTIETKTAENKIIYELPIKSFNNKKTNLIAKKLCNKLSTESIKNVVLSNSLLECKTLKQMLKANGINILDGTKLYKILLPKILETICTYRNTNLQEEKISILINENDEININNILELAKNVKSLNIVTKDTLKFKKIVEYLYEEFGIIIKLSNNLKKDLLNSNIIINIDFSEEVINKYVINPKAVIINIPSGINIYSKKFIGININSYNIIIPKEYKLAGFENKYIYDGIIYSNSSKEAKEKIKKDNIKILNFIGKNGLINKKEFLIN